MRASRNSKKKIQSRKNVEFVNINTVIGLEPLSAYVNKLYFNTLNVGSAHVRPLAADALVYSL